MKEPINMCDVVLYDGKAKKEYRLFDAILVGNDKDLIWKHPHFRDRLIRDVFKTKARISRQQENLHLVCKDIKFKKFINYSNVKWGCTK
jgi:hypothetical protein